MTFEQGNLLHTLGIAREDPWAWVSSDGPIAKSTAAPRLRVAGPEGVPDTCPFPWSWSERWAGYEVLLVGVMAEPWVLDNALRATGLPWRWDDDGRRFAVQLYYQRIRHPDSHLYADILTSPKERRNAGVQGAHLGAAHRPDRERAWRGLDLLQQGPARGAPKRKRGPRGAERRRWWLLTQQIGWEAAKVRYYAEGGTGAEWKQIQRHKTGTDK